MKDHQKLNLVEDNALRFWLAFSYNPKVSKTERIPGRSFRDAMEALSGL